MELDDKQKGIIGVIFLVVGIVLLAMTGSRFPGSLNVIINSPEHAYMGIGYVIGFFIGLALLIIGILALLNYVKKTK